MGKWLSCLARLARRFASGAFRPVRKLTKTVSAVAGVLRRTTIPGSDAEHIAIDRDADSDCRIDVNPARSVRKVSELLDEFRDSAARFEAGVPVLCVLIDTVRTVAGDAALGGWFGLVRPLVRICSNLTKLGLLGKRRRNS